MRVPCPAPPVPEELLAAAPGHHLQDFALGALLEEQGLLVGRVAGLLHHLGLLLGQADAVLQQVNLHVGGCIGKGGEALAWSPDMVLAPSPSLPSHLPGMDLEPIFGMSPLAWITSTSSCPLRSAMPTWTSPGQGKGRAQHPSRAHLPRGRAAAQGWDSPRPSGSVLAPRCPHPTACPPHPQHPAESTPSIPPTGFEEGQSQRAGCEGLRGTGDGHLLPPSCLGQGCGAGAHHCRRPRGLTGVLPCSSRRRKHERAPVSWPWWCSPTYAVLLVRTRVPRPPRPRRSLPCGLREAGDREGPC